MRFDGMFLNRSTYILYICNAQTANESNGMYNIIIWTQYLVIYMICRYIDSYDC